MIPTLAKMEKQNLIGCFVKPDGWNLGECLIESDWTEAQYRLPDYNNNLQLAINIEITGRIHRFDSPLINPAMRCKVIFIHDGEPNVTTGGWISWPS